MSTILRIESRSVEGLDDLPLPPQNADVRSVKLVGRAGEEVASDRVHIDEVVRRVVHGVDEDDGVAGGFREPTSGGDVRNRADRVRRGADRQDLRPGVERRFQARPIQPAVVQLHLHGAYGYAAIALQRAPGRDIAVMVELRDDDLVALAKLPSDRAGEMEGEARHVLPERDFVRPAVQEVGERFA